MTTPTPASDGFTVIPAASDPVRFDIDLNNINKHSQIKTALRRASGPVAVGDSVLAVEPYDAVCFEAKVESIDTETGRVLLALDWDSETDVIAPPA